MSSSPLQPTLRPGVDPAAFAARAIGRTPEEHEQLERMLAERRRARRTGVRFPHRDIDIAAAERESLRRQEERQREVLRRREEYHREVCRLDEERQRELRRLDELQQIEAAAEHFRANAEAHRRRADRSLPISSAPEPSRPLEGSTAQRRAALLAPFGFTRRRPAKGASCRGSGWHKKGWRFMGEMWINVKVGGEYTRGQDVDEDLTLAGFVEQIQSSQEGTDFQPSNGQTWDLLFRKKSLRQLLVDMEAQGLRGDDVLVRFIFVNLRLFTRPPVSYYRSAAFQAHRPRIEGSRLSAALLAVGTGTTGC
ncbi:hypothetical protein VPNG_00081 [Cytospora leucostoma]|uniref:Uncharacterized protein n=1 Tax=Cytospora leucostoma TaxID=1230097 RepID=A0A423XPC7_9PEZI|nr:hypothetical protein VPNG_00081 [Cytospora leucostoma]